MGPKGGDEVNLILPGRNYGYPIVSDGEHYDDKPIPDHDTRPEFEKYKVMWNPVISPGGLMVYSGKLFPQWKGDLFIGGLSSQALIRVDVDGTSATQGRSVADGHPHPRARGRARRRDLAARRRPARRPGPPAEADPGRPQARAGEPGLNSSPRRSENLMVLLDHGGRDARETDIVAPPD